MKSILKRIWMHILIWGVLSILFGVISFAWPGLTLRILVYLFAVSVIAEGIAILAGLLGARARNQNWWIMLLTGIINVVAGIICLVYPGITALFFITLIGVSWLITGFMELFAAISLRKEIRNEGWLALAGLLSIIAGLFLIFRTGEGALAMIWLIAGFAIIFGVVLILLSLKAKHWGTIL